MKDTELYGRLLGLRSPWFVRQVCYEDHPERIAVYIDHTAGMEMPCPVCGCYSGVYDHLPERQWQHLPTCQVPTFVHARLPRIRCLEHGVRSVLSDWSDPGAEVTRALECRLIDLEKECSVEGVSRLTGLSWERCWGILERAVDRGLQRKEWKLPTHMGVDEKAFGRGQDYETVVCDLEEGVVEFVGDGRRQESLAEYFLPFAEAERAQVASVCLDMWEPYITTLQTYIPGAADKMVFDKFHVMSLLNEAVDQVRRQEHKALTAQQNELLKGTKYWWLYNPTHVPEDVQSEFARLRQLNLKVSRAWAIKELFRQLWDYRRAGWAQRFFRRWYFWATHSRLEPIIKVAKTLKRHLSNLLTYLVHRFTNALSESLNTQIEKLKRMACGFRNREHFKKAIYFHCGGLDLYPRAPNPPTTISCAYPH